jgi:hypothetical protein
MAIILSQRRQRPNSNSLTQSLRSWMVEAWSRTNSENSRMLFNISLTLGARVPGFQWEHAEYIAGIETLCPAFAQQEHPVHI